MRAVVASLLEVELDEVPDFVHFDNRKDTNSYYEMYKFLKQKGYHCGVINPRRKYVNHRLYKPNRKAIAFVIDCLKVDGGIGGYFYASVPSQTFKDVTHTVVIDSDMNIVHDPNPNQKCLKLKKTDILSVVTNSNKWRIDIDGKIIMRK